METKDILGTAVGLGSLSLVGKSAGMVKDSFKGKLSSGKMTKGFVDLSVGTALLSSVKL